MSELGTRAPTPERQRLGSSRPITLQPISNQDAVTEATEPAVTEVTEPAVTEKTTTAQKKQKTVRVAQTQTTPPAVKNSSSATFGVGLRLGETLYAQLTQYKKTEGLSYPTIVLVAVQSTYRQLAALLAERSIQIDTGTEPNIFALPAQVARRSTTATEPKRILLIKISPERHDVLKQIVTLTGASSVNELICTALEAFLPRPGSSNSAGHLGDLKNLPKEH